MVSHLYSHHLYFIHMFEFRARKNYTGKNENKYKTSHSPFNYSFHLANQLTLKIQNKNESNSVEVGHYSFVATCELMMKVEVIISLNVLNVGFPDFFVSSVKAQKLTVDFLAFLQ